MSPIDVDMTKLARTFQAMEPQFDALVKEIDRRFASEWMEPDWTAGIRIANWRDHVPDPIKAIWYTFNPEQREALYRWAKTLAQVEDWD